jgi:hypothetical protein
MLVLEPALSPMISVKRTFILISASLFLYMNIIIQWLKYGKLKTYILSTIDTYWGTVMISQEQYKFQEKVNSLHNWLQNKAGTLRYSLLMKVLMS